MQLVSPITRKGMFGGWGRAIAAVFGALSLVACVAVLVGGGAGYQGGSGNTLELESLFLSDGEARRSMDEDYDHLGGGSSSRLAAAKATRGKATVGGEVKAKAVERVVAKANKDEHTDEAKAHEVHEKAAIKQALVKTVPGVAGGRLALGDSVKRSVVDDMIKKALLRVSLF